MARGRQEFQRLQENPSFMTFDIKRLVSTLSEKSSSPELLEPALQDGVARLSDLWRAQGWIAAGKFVPVCRGNDGERIEDF